MQCQNQTLFGVFSIDYEVYDTEDNHICSIKNKKELSEIYNKAIEEGTTSVSYTHLDVYKRQNPALVEDDKVYRHIASVKQEEVEELYFELQKQHRAVEASLNAIKGSRCV